MTVTVAIGEVVEVTVEDDSSYTPDVFSDLAHRAVEAALSLYERVQQTTPKP